MQDKMWRAIAKAIFVSGNALSMLEEPHWIEAFKLIRPGLKLPSRYQLSNDLLDREFATLRSNITSRIMECLTIGIQCDSWTNNRQINNFLRDKNDA